METTHISKRPWLFVPIETKARELYGKLLLAAVAAEKGFGVVIGHRSATRGIQKQLPRGMFLEKSIASTRKNSIAKINKEGNRISAWDEEGLLYFDPHTYFQARIDPSLFDEVDLFFTWGEKQADELYNVLGYGEEKIIPSGNPRFDILRPELRDIYKTRVEKIQHTYGNIILVNTKFPVVNNILRTPEEKISAMKAEGRIQNEKAEKLQRKRFDFQERIFQEFLKITPVLSKEFSDHSIIVRTHPGENSETWVRETKNLSNVHVVHEGSANEWMLAADVTIQNNCTTSFESFLLGRPTIAFRPVKDEEIEFNILNQLSLGANNTQELVTIIKSVIADTGNNTFSDESYAQKQKHAKEYVANIDGELACDTIVNSVEKLNLPAEEATFPISRPLLLKIKRAARQLKNFVFSHKGWEYEKKKFPGLTKKEVEDILDVYKNLTKRFNDVQTTQVIKNGFCIYK